MMQAVSVPRPDDSPALVACVVRGYNSGAIQDGWIVYFNNLELPPTDDLVGKLVMVKSTGSEILLRTIKRGRLPNRWDLFTTTGPAMLDIEHYAWSADDLAAIEAIG